MILRTNELRHAEDFAIALMREGVSFRYTTVSLIHMFSFDHVDEFNMRKADPVIKLYFGNDYKEKRK